MGNTQTASVEIKAFYCRKTAQEKVYYTFNKGDKDDIDAYHAALFKFVLRCWTQFHNETAKKTGEEFMSEKEMLALVKQPDVPMVMTVWDENGTMVKFNSAEEFVAALSNFNSWEKCLHVETYKYKPAPAPAPAPAAAPQPAVVEAAPQPAAVEAAPQPGAVEAAPQPAVVEAKNKH